LTLSPSFTFLPGDINKPKHLKYTNKQNKNQQSWELFIIEDSTLKSQSISVYYPTSEIFAPHLDKSWTDHIQFGLDSPMFSNFNS
jgi:hypothetical protein